MAEDWDKAVSSRPDRMASLQLWLPGQDQASQHSSTDRRWKTELAIPMVSSTGSVTGPCSSQLYTLTQDFVQSLQSGLAPSQSLCYLALLELWSIFLLTLRLCTLMFPSWNLTPSMASPLAPTCPWGCSLVIHEAFPYSCHLPSLD